ncbi:TPA: hypothetical protein ACVO3M_004633, partial [Vibrio diabolicus]
MLINAQELHSSLVKVSSGLTGSGVWINMGHSDYSYVFTAKHNIKSDQTIVTDQNATELDIVKVIPLDGIDISIIKINGRCKVNVGLCLNKDEELSKDSTCWILGHPKSLVNNSEHQVIDHEGKIIVHSDKMFFQIDDILPEYRDRTLAEGFSGGPIFEIEKNQIYLKGIITDTFDDDFNYQRIKGIKLIDIHNNLPQE